MARWRAVGVGRLLASVVLAAACGGEGQGGAEDGGLGPTVRDSSGVRIVENGVPVGEWRVAEEPLFTVGWDEDGPLFTWAQSGSILPDGGALIGEFATGTIYRLGPDGALVDSLGRKGEGPGEYGGFDALLGWGDSILVSDGRLRRLTVLTSGGDVQATRPLPGSFLHRVDAVLADGRLLLVPGEGYMGVAEGRPEWVFETQPILAAASEGGTIDTLAELPHLRRWFGMRGASPGPVPVKGRAGGFPEGFAWARADLPEVRWYDAAGSLTQVARWREDPVPLTAERRRQMRERLEAMLGAGGTDESIVTARLAELDEGLDRHEGPMPYWNSLHVDRGGNVWLARYAPIGEPPGSWRIVARDGTFRGWLDLGGAVTILDATDDRVLTVFRDEFDVPAVVMIELIKE